MKIYLVGGAVRDKLLGNPCHDNDYMITGATEEELLKLGYKKVGRHFPVFLHPKTGAEYALARKEIKTGPRHCDFKFIFTPDITLKEDSERRDFTCNALYEDIKTGEIIDYHNGRIDIKNRILRHVSNHFSEDPLRVLRMCRFSAQLDFEIAPETMKLAQKMVKNGAIRNLSKDRIWQELQKALCSKSFYRFVEIAKECGALKEILPEVEQLWQIPERTDYHPEGNSGAHTMLALKAAQTTDSLVNFTVLLHDIGKTQTNPAFWPSHRGHDILGAGLIPKIAHRLKAPSLYSEFASFATANHMLYHRPITSVAKEMASVAIILSEKQDKDYFARYIAVLKADMQGRKKEEFSEELKEFAIFEQYLKRLTKTASEHSLSTLPDFQNLLNLVQMKTLPPTAIKEARIAHILANTPQ